MLVAIVQARMSSRRLPGKVLTDILGRPMLLHQLDRIARSRVDRVVVATSTETSDDPVQATVEQAGYRCYRGSLDDVLDRLYQAARSENADHVVRLTADCPIIDHRIIDAVIGQHLDEGNDYTSNTLERTYPDGLDTEMATMDAFTRAWREAGPGDEREHVTPYIYRHPDEFRLGNVALEPSLGHLRWTVDYPEDLAVIREIFDELHAADPGFSMQDVLALFARRPELERINAAVNPFIARPQAE